MTGVVEMVPPEAVAVPGPAVWPEAVAELFALVAGGFAPAPSRPGAREGGGALMARERSLPGSGAEGRDGGGGAGIGEEGGFATKPGLARKMLGGAVAAGVPFAWFTADEAYGQNPGLRDWLEEQRIAYVIAVPVSEPRATAAGKTRADALAARVPAGGWQGPSCGRRSKSPRPHDLGAVGPAGRGQPR